MTIGEDAADIDQANAIGDDVFAMISEVDEKVARVFGQVRTQMAYVRQVNGSDTRMGAISLDFYAANLMAVVTEINKIRESIEVIKDRIREGQENGKRFIQNTAM